MAAVGFVQARTLRTTIPGRCDACGAIAGFDVEYTETRAVLLIAPLVAFNSPKEGRCRACGKAPPIAVFAALPRPSAIWRFGWLFFFVAPIVVFGGAYGVYEWFHVKAMREASQQKEAAHAQLSKTSHDYDRARRDCGASFDQADKLQKACTKDLNDGYHAATKDVDHERVRAPKEHIGKLPLALMGRPVVPESPILGDDPCPDPVPRNDLGYSTATSTCNALGKSPDEIRAIGTKALDAAPAKAPDRFILLSFDCGKTTCGLTAAVIDRPSKSIVAVTRTTKPKANDAHDDKVALADALTKKLAAWP